MRRMLQDNPHALWRLLAMALPLWGVAACAMVVWIQTWAIPKGVTPRISTPSEAPAPAADTSMRLEQYRAVWQRSLRQQLVERKEPEEAAPPPQRPRMTLSLLGIAAEGTRSYAILQHANGRIAVAGLGAQIDSFRVERIGAAEVALTRDGMATVLKLPEHLRRFVPEDRCADHGLKATTAKFATREEDHETSQDRLNDAGLPSATSDEMETPPSPSLPRVMVLGGLNSQTFLDEVRLVPGTAPQGPRGFRIDSVAEGARVAQSGLQAGDLITAVDGAPLEKLSDLDRILTSLDSSQPHEWRIYREGRSIKVELKSEE